uniref:Malate dehydrogenase n=1 Tax=Salix viminalis TaxID=40686 RepID=A0A6N2LFE1_SALVM
MARTSAATFSAGSTVAFGTKASQFHNQTLSCKIQFQKSLATFSGLKAATFVKCESESSFLGKESSAALRAPVVPQAQKSNQKSQYHVNPQASYKVAILGAAGGIGQPSALLVKMSPLVSALHLYDIGNVKGVAADISHCNTPAQVCDFTGRAELPNSLKGVDVVVIPAGFQGSLTLVEAVADNCPDAFIHIISNPVNSNMPIAAEVLKKKGVYDPKKLLCVTTLDVVRANTFVALKKNLRVIDVDVPVCKVRIQNAGTEVVEAKAGAGSATLSMAYAAARFVESSLRALDGDADVYECSFVQSDLTELPFFASKVKLGRKGVEALISSDLQGLTTYEQEALETSKPELKASIEKGIAFAQKQTVSA